MQIRTVYGERCLDAPPSGLNGAVIQANRCLDRQNRPSQFWEYSGGKIRSVGLPGKCVDVADEPEARVILRPCAAVDSQRWTRVKSAIDRTGDFFEYRHRGSRNHPLAAKGGVVTAGPRVAGGALQGINTDWY